MGIPTPFIMRCSHVVVLIVTLESVIFACIDCPTYSPNKDPPSRSESLRLFHPAWVRLYLRRDKVHGQQMTRMHIGVIRDLAALPAPL